MPLIRSWALLAVVWALGAAAEAASELSVVNRTPLLVAAPGLDIATRGEDIVLRGRVYWKTVHGEDVDAFVLDVTFTDADGVPIGRGTFDSAQIRLGVPFESTVGRWGTGPGRVDRARARSVVLTVRTLQTLLTC